MTTVRRASRPAMTMRKKRAYSPGSAPYVARWSAGGIFAYGVLRIRYGII